MLWTPLKLSISGHFQVARWARIVRAGACADAGRAQHTSETIRIDQYEAVRKPSPPTNRHQITKPSGGPSGAYSRGGPPGILPGGHPVGVLREVLSYPDSPSLNVALGEVACAFLDVFMWFSQPHLLSETPFAAALIPQRNPPG